MLAKVSWQSINCAIEPDECRHARMIFRQACLFDLRFEFERVREIATGKQMGETIDNAWRKIERFADLVCRLLLEKKKAGQWWCTAGAVACSKGKYVRTLYGEGAAGDLI